MLTTVIYLQTYPYMSKGVSKMSALSNSELVALFSIAVLQFSDSLNPQRLIL